MNEVSAVEMLTRAVQLIVRDQIRSAMLALEAKVDELETTVSQMETRVDPWDGLWSHIEDDVADKATEIFDDLIGEVSLSR